MPKFQLKASPTFVSTVGFPVAGGESVDVQITFKHRTKTELEEFVKGRGERTDADLFMDMVVGWDLLDEFKRENVDTLVENHMGVALATYQAYIAELIRHRAKN